MQKEAQHEMKIRREIPTRNLTKHTIILFGTIS